MVLNGKELSALIEKYEDEAQKNYRNYQETGMSRYERAQHKAEDLADTLKVALGAVAEHQKLCYYRGQLHHIASAARRVKDPGEAQHILTSIIAIAEMDGLIGKENTI